MAKELYALGGAGAESLSGDILGNLMKIRAISSGTSSANKFQLNLKIQMS